MDDSTRFWSKVTKSETCWLWTAYKDPHGYGRFSAKDQKAKLAHRHAYEETVGPIPPGAELDHLCHMPACVNPSHLRPASHKGNLEHLRGAQRNSTTGVRGVFLVRGKWRAQVMHQGETIYLGTFDDHREAAAVAVVARSILFTHSDHDSRAADEALAAITPHGMRFVEKARNWTPGAGRPLRTACDRGHEYTDENTRLNRDGSRSCRTCNRENMRRQRAAAKAVA